MLGLRVGRRRGDTIVEAMFAITVFSLVIVSSLSIMNQGSASAERAIEITQVRQTVNAQAEALRLMNAAYVAAYASGAKSYASDPAQQWLNMRSTSGILQQDAIVSQSGSCPVNPPSNSFVINARTSKFVKLNSSNFNPASTFSRLNYNSDNTLSLSEGVWVLAKDGGTDTSGSGFIDFYIRACWDDPSESTPLTLDTVVRLYEPRG